MSDNPFESDDTQSSPDINPYQAPQITTSASGFDDVGDADPSLDRAANMLRQTKPWVRFVSVMLFIGAALMVLLGLVLVIGGMANAMPMPFGGMLGLIYIAMACLYVVPGVFLWAYANRIRVFLDQRTPGTLASALESQKSFWRFVGISLLVIMCLYGVMLVALVGATIIGAGGPWSLAVNG